MGRGAVLWLAVLAVDRVGDKRLELNLTGKSVVVTGATRNLGEAIVQGLLAEGANVVATYRSDDSAARVMKSRVNPSWVPRLSVERWDASRVTDCDALCRAAVNRYGQLDVLVNSAAVILSQPVDAITDADFDFVMQNSLRSMLYMTRSAFKVMRAQGRGRIVSLSTAGVATANPNELLYLCAKAGVEAATRAFARLGGPFGITANVVAPHVIQAGMGIETLTADPSIVDRIPLHRPGEVDELVATVLFLCSDRAEYLNGQVLSLNGGRIMK
jgi:3-oxoacyl-[acyl-carrier protein] reductase